MSEDLILEYMWRFLPLTIMGALILLRSLSQPSFHMDVEF